MTKLKKFTKTLLATTLTLALGVGAFTGCGKKKDTETTEKSSEQITEQVTDEATTGDSTSTAPTELKPFRIGACGSEEGIQAELLSLANAKGYLEEELEKEGYKLEIVTFQNGPEISAALAAGDLDAATFGDFPAFVSKGNGIESTIIAATNTKMQYGILAATDDIRTPKDLEGKRVIVGQGTVIQFFWEEYVKQNDLDASKIQVINATDGASLLSTGEADAYVSIRTATEYMQSLGLGKVFDDGSNVDAYTTAVVIVDNKYLEANKAAAVAVDRALLKAYDDATANPDDFYESVATSTMPVEIIRTGYTIDSTLSQLNPELTDDVKAYYGKLNDWLVSQGILFANIDIDGFADNTYIEQAKESLGK